MPNMIPNLGRIRNAPMTNNSEMVIISGKFKPGGVDSTIGSNTFTPLDTLSGAGFQAFQFLGPLLNTSKARFFVYLDSPYGRMYSFSANVVGNTLSTAGYICLVNSFGDTTSPAGSGVPGTSFADISVVLCDPATGATSSGLVPATAEISFMAMVSTSRILE